MKVFQGNWLPDEMSVSSCVDLLGADKLRVEFGSMEELTKRQKSPADCLALIKALSTFLKMAYKKVNKKGFIIYELSK